jgi:CO/xanthine dehydrogenase Mo-binding subunit
VPAPLRREGPAKLTGAAKYTDDLVFPGAWYGATIRSTEPHARLLGFDLADDFDWSTVVFLTAKDIPGDNIVSELADDQPALADDEIQHHAEAVALLAAPDRATLREAKKRVKARTEPLPAVFDPLESRHVFTHYEVDRGDPAGAMAAADLVIEDTYRTGHQEQLYIENQAMIAVPRPDGGIEIHGSMQCPYYVHTGLKRVLGIDDVRAVVIQEETGGGFGGKEEYPTLVAVHAALLAQRVGKPVRMIYDRHEDLAATTKRHPSVIRSRFGVTRDGRLLAQEIEVILDGGAYTTLSPVVLSRATLHAAGPYRCDNVSIHSRVVATNTPPNGAFRGFGAPQVQFATETQTNRIAEVLGISPYELRRLWAYRVGDTTPTGQVLRESVAALEVLDRAAEASEFERVRGRTAEMRTDRMRTDRAASGIGMALAWHGAGFTGSGEQRLASEVRLELDAADGIRVFTASTEIGQGTKTIFPQLVAGELGIPLEDVVVAANDTSQVPNSGPTVASRTAMVVGGLLVDAARHLREEVEGRTGRPFADSYREDAALHGPTVVREKFDGYPGIDWDDKAFRGDAYPAFGWACAVAEVDVDRDTGEVHVRSVVAADDVGHAIHRVMAEGQVEGGTLQAVGYATIEEIKLDNGRYMNDRLATYLIPTALDAPRITSILVEEPYSGAPHGAKGVGELPMDVAAPAVVAAVHDAIGVWITELPATPERVVAALAAPRQSAPAERE